MWCFDHDRGITHREGLGEFSNWRRISDEVDDNGLSAAANIELCEGGCRAQRVDAHAVVCSAWLASATRDARVVSW
jgi:hypothetical protein